MFCNLKLLITSYISARFLHFIFLVKQTEKYFKHFANHIMHIVFEF